MFKTMSKTNHLFALASLGCLLLTGSSPASTLLLGWNFTAAGAPSNTTGEGPTVNSTTNDPNIQASALTSGAGMDTTGPYYASYGPYIVARGGALNEQWVYWTGGSPGWDSVSLAASKANNAYIQWIIAPISGNQMSLSSLDLGVYTQGLQGTEVVQVEYSLNGFATAGTTVGTTGAGPGGWISSIYTLPLAGFADLQGTTSSVTFRAYGYGFNPAGYNDEGFGLVGNTNGVAINGTATSIPEPVSLGMGLLGLGIIVLGRRR